MNTLVFLGNQINDFTRSFSLGMADYSDSHCHIKPVQFLFNYARGATHCINSMKKRFVKADLAYYDSDGKFQFRDKVEDND